MPYIGYKMQSLNHPAEAYYAFMQEEFIRTLQAGRKQICARWEVFLRIERVNSPLANPDTLVYLFDQTLDEVFELLADPLTRRSSAQLAEVSDKNPLVAYYKAGEQALLEALIQAQAKSPTLDPKWRDTDLAKLKLVLRTIARREIVAWEGICRLEKSPRQGAPSSSN